MPTATILLQNGNWADMTNFDGVTVNTAGVTADANDIRRTGFSFPLSALPPGVAINSLSLRLTLTFNDFPVGSSVDVAQGTFAGSAPTTIDWDSFGSALATMSTAGTGVRTLPLSPLPDSSSGVVKLMLVSNNSAWIRVNTTPVFDGSKAALIVDYADPSPEGEIGSALADDVANFSGYIPIVGEVSSALGDSELDMRDAVGVGVGIATQYKNVWATRVATGGSGVSGIGSGTIELHGGIRPSINTVVNAAPLVVFEVPSTSGANISGDTVTIANTPPALVLVTGTPTWARVYDGAGFIMADTDVVAPGAGGGIALSTPTVVAGQTLRLGTFSYKVR